MSNNGARPESQEQLFHWVETGDLGINDALIHLNTELGRQISCARKETSDALPSLEESMLQLDALIGLEEVKRLVKELQAFVEIQRRREAVGLANERLVLHMIFKGNPGTGKTTVARILGAILRAMGVLAKGHLVEVERADLVGEYVGHTAQKTREQMRRALGGILFIDEAYALARGGEKDFGKEAIDTLVKAMEDHKDQLIIILAGYRQEMEQFLQTNPGLRSRFPIHMEFGDFGLDELLDIADLMLVQRQYALTREGRAKLKEILATRFTKEVVPSNARLVRNIIEKAIRLQAVRLVANIQASRDDLLSITARDLEETTHYEGLSGHR